MAVRRSCLLKEQNWLIVYSSAIQKFYYLLQGNGHLEGTDCVHVRGNNWYPCVFFSGVSKSHGSFQVDLVGDY